MLVLLNIMRPTLAVSQNYIGNVFVTIRPRQWYKNSLLLAGLVFSLNLTNLPMLIAVLTGFISFCGLSSSEYIINDIFDRERDRKHPVKYRRPIASGALRMSRVLPLFAVLVVLSLVMAYRINIAFFRTP